MTPLSPRYELPCVCCEGSGVIVSVLHVAGEAFDADLSETQCDACEGTGGVILCCYCDDELETNLSCPCIEDEE